MDSIRLWKEGVYLTAEGLIPAAGRQASARPAPAEAARGTMAYRILAAHNSSGNMEDLQIHFDQLISHDITYVGIIQTARASGLTKFPLPYVLTNCHNSLCAVGGTINEDDHMFGLSCAKKYGGAYVPPHQAVIHQYAREMMASCGAMILGSDSHTRYGALGTMAVGEGGPELVKQLLNRTYDIAMPEVTAVYLTGKLAAGVGPQDVALAIMGAVFRNGFVKNRVMEFVGPGIGTLTMDERIGIDVMTTETTCLSSIWETDEQTEEYLAIHGRPEAYRRLAPEAGAYYDRGMVIDLSSIRPMIAMPFHPSNVYPIHEVKQNLKDILAECEERAKVSFGSRIPFTLQDKIVDGRLYVEQGIIAGCAGGGFENICAAADILRGRSIGDDRFTMSVYPASMPIFRELMKNGVAADLVDAGVVIKTAFCGPCFGAGDTPANNALSIRHSTRNFPNREGSRVQDGQIASVALMDARSIAATAAAGGYLTGADELDVAYTGQKYYFDRNIYEKRVFDSHGTADPKAEVQMGPNIKDWPEMIALPENVLLRVASVIHDPVTTTDELIPSGETSSYRSNPEALSQFALSRKDPRYVGRAKEIRALELARRAGKQVQGDPAAQAVSEALTIIKEQFPDCQPEQVGLGTVVYAVKPGDGSAREQAASCQKVLGGWANIAREYATKRYRSNLINWGMIPFILPGETADGAGEPGEDLLPFGVEDFIFLPGIRGHVAAADRELTAYVVKEGRMEPFTLEIGGMTDDERQIILDGCLINYYKNSNSRS